MRKRGNSKSGDGGVVKYFIEKDKPPTISKIKAKEALRLGRSIVRQEKTVTASADGKATTVITRLLRIDSLSEFPD